MRGLFGFLSGEAPPPVPLAKVRRRYANGEPMPLAWLRDCAHGWVEYDGTRIPKDDRDAVVARVTIEGGAWEQLHWADTDLVHPHAESGWLSPEGVWYGCRPQWHEVVAALVLRAPPAELARTFAHVFERSHTVAPTATGRFTPAQATWLRARGFYGGDAREFERAEVERAVRASGRPLKRYRGSGD